MISEEALGRIKAKLEEWAADIFTGVGFSGFASWLKYVYQHFIDIGWTVAAAVFVTIAVHYVKKIILPRTDKIFKKWFPKEEDKG